MQSLIFNLHDVMLLMTGGLAILLAVPVIMRRGRRARDLLLAGFVLTQGMTALYFLVLYAPAFRPTTLALLGPFHSLPIIFLFTIQGPLLYWYSLAMAGLKVEVRPGDKLCIALMVGLPFVALLVLWLINPLLDTIFSGLLSLPALIASLVYGLCARRTLKDHDAAIREQYSTIDDIDLVWLRYSVHGFSFVWCLRLIGLVMMFVGSKQLVEFFSSIANVPAMILIALMVILGLEQSRKAPPVKARSKQNDDVPKKTEMISRLTDLMERVRLYQDPELDLDGLADSLGTSSRSLSALINTHYQMNFYDFVNGYRVREAQSALEDPTKSDVTVQRIFEDAGFRSKSTFYAFFKKVTGLTPTEYRQSPQA